MARILLVDDEKHIVAVLSSVLKNEKFEVETASNGEAALAILKEKEIDLLLSDLRMTPMDGMSLLTEAKKIQPDLAAVMVTAYGSVETALEVKRLGAYDYVPKPFKVDELLQTIREALKFQTEEATDISESEGSADYFVDTIIAKNASMQEACKKILQSAPITAPVIITGPRGTGKATLARVLHDNSPRKEEAFVRLQCNECLDRDIDAALLGEAEIDGKKVQTDGGTLLLEEVGNLSMDMQSRLYTAVRKKEITPPDSKKPVPFDVRIIAGTSSGLEGLVAQGKFDSELYGMLSQIVIKVPPLSQRREDILPLIHHFVREGIGEEGEMPMIDPEAYHLLEAFAWPGNVEQLAKIIEQALKTLEGNKITKASLPPAIVDSPAGLDGTDTAAPVTTVRGKRLKGFIQNKEKELLESIVQQAGGDLVKAAQMLDMSVAKLKRKLNQE